MRVPWGTLILLLLVADAASLWLLHAWLRDGGRGWFEAAAGVVIYVVLAGFLGVWAIRAGGFSSLRAAARALSRNKEPTDDLLNGLLAFVGGILVAFPGLASDALGLALLLPPTRWVARRALRRGARVRYEKRSELEVEEYRVE